MISILFINKYNANQIYMSTTVMKYRLLLTPLLIIGAGFVYKYWSNQYEGIANSSGYNIVNVLLLCDNCHVFVLFRIVF